MMRHLRITVDGRAYDVIVEDIADPSQAGVSTLPPPSAAVPPALTSSSASAPSAAPRAAAAPQVAGGPDNRLAPLAGVVLEVNAKVGDTVDIDDQLLVLEAMKMKTVIGAHKAGQVTAIHVKPGDAVEADQPLVTIGS